MPKVSILLTCFNHIRFLAAAWESINQQTFRDYEIVAIDDGSTDGTREWLSARSEPLVRIFNESNLGTYASLNVALAAASGDYVAILNDDDIWAPAKLEKQVDLFQSDGSVGLVHTGGRFIDEEGSVLDGSPLGFDFPSSQSADPLISLVYANNIIASAALVKRECFERLGAFNEGYFGSADWEMWLRIGEEYNIGFVPEQLTFYRVHSGNASNSLDRIWRDDEKLREWIATRAEAYAKRSRTPGAFDDLLAHNQACLGTAKVLNGDTTGGRKAYAASIKLHPGRIKTYFRYAASFLPKSVFKSFR